MSVRRRARYVLALALIAAAPQLVQAQTAPAIAKISAVASGSFLDTISFGSLPTVGCLAGIAVGTRNSAIAALVIGDNQGNTYGAPRAIGGDTNINVGIWLAPVVTSSGTFTIDVDDDNEEVNGTGLVFEVCGADASFVDDDGGFSNVDSASQSCDLANTTFSHDLVLGAIRLSNSASGVAITEAMGWTLAGEREAGEEFSMIYQQTTATGNFDPAWTLASSHFTSGVCLSIKGTGSAAVPRGTLSTTGAGR